MPRHLLGLPILAILAAIPLWATHATPAAANHSWSGYHWGRESNPFTLKLVKKLDTSADTNWASILGEVAGDWGASGVVNTQIENGSGACNSIGGKVVVCNDEYGNTGWLGLAQIGIGWSGKGFKHITWGMAKVNDTYLGSGYSEDEQQSVLCQEIGHTLGLDHQHGKNAGTSCMADDFDPDPNQHDYDQLALIYAHLDASATIGAAAPSSASGYDPGNRPADWGAPVQTGPDGKPMLYRKQLSGGRIVFTWVRWAPGHGP